MERFKISSPALCELPLIEAPPDASEAAHRDSRQTSRRAFGWHKHLARWVGTVPVEKTTRTAEAKS